ncbi:MAG: PKD domain-containing protein [Thermoplasmata archaeon]
MYRVGLALAVVAALLVVCLSASPGAVPHEGSGRSTLPVYPGFPREAPGTPPAERFPSLFAGGPGVVEWPTISFDLQHTAANLQEATLAPSNVSALTPLWTFHTPGGVSDSLAVVNGTAYFGDWNGTLYAVNAYTGALDWKVSLGGSDDYTGCDQPGIASTATVWNNTVYIGGSNPWEYAVNASTGTVLWHLDLANSTGASSPWTAYKAWSSALVVNGNLYVGTSSGCDSPLVRAALLQISLATHTIEHIAYTVNATDIGDSIWSSPSYDRATNTVWATTGNGLSDLEEYARSIMAFNASNVTDVIGYAQEAAPHNDYDFGDGVTIFHNSAGTPMVVAVNKNGYAYAFNLSTFRGNVSASPAWTLQVTTVPGESYSPPAFDGQSLYFGSDNTTLPNGTAVNGSIMAVNPNNGSLRWIVPLPYSIFGGLTYVNGLVVAGLTGGFSNPTEGGLVVLNATDGQTLYFRPGPATWGEPVVVDGELLFTGGNLSSSAGGAVTALALPLSGSYSPSVVPGVPQTTYGLRAHAEGGVLPYNFTWAFGEGNVSYGPTVTQGFAAAGQYPSNLTIRDAAGTVVVVPFTLTANAPLSATPSLTPNPVPSRGASWFNLSVAGAMPPYRFDWTGLPPGNAVPNNMTGDILVRGPVEGEFNLTAVVSSSTLQSVLVPFPTWVVDGPTVIAIDAQPRSGTAPLNVSFSVSFGTTPVAAAYSWTFGDGGASAVASPFHDYLQPGTYSVNVTTTYPGGSRATATTTVIVGRVGAVIFPAVAIGAGAGLGIVVATVTFWRHRRDAAGP